MKEGMTQDKNQCSGCPVHHGTHKPADALHQQIAEPQPEALRLADALTVPECTLEHGDCMKAGELLRSQQARIEQLEEALHAANGFILDKNIPYEPRMHDWLDVMDSDAPQSAQQAVQPLRNLALSVTSYLDHAGMDTSRLPAGMGAALRRLRDAAIATAPAAQEGQDAANWKHVLSVVSGMKTSEYERLCDLFDLPHDSEFSAAIAAQAAQGGA